MDDIAARYAPMIEQMAEMHASDEAVHAQLRSLKVTREEWDTDGRGGHFWFDVCRSSAAGYDFLVEARADDLDGAKIDVILHSVDGTLEWGEWYRLSIPPDDLKQPIQRWPPPSLNPSPP